MNREHVRAEDSHSVGSRPAATAASPYLKRWRMVPLAFTLAVALGLLVTSMASAPTAQAHGLLDQSSPGFPASNGAGVFDDFHSGRRFQEFTPSNSPLTAVDLVVGKFNPTQCPADFTVKIRSGSTDGPILGETTLSGVTPEFFEPPSILHFDFAPVIAVVTGNVHYIESRTTTTCGGLHILNIVNPNSSTVVSRTFGAFPVGGISLDSDLRLLPLETTNPDSSPWAVLVGIVAVAGFLTVGGAAWYAKKRLTD